MMEVSVIGTGRLGTALAAALARRKYLIKAISDRDSSAARESRRIIGHGRISSHNSIAAAAADIVFLCLPDDAVRGEAALLAGSGVDWRGKRVFHTSGLLTSAALDPLKRRGALVASIHPIQSFPSKRTPPSRFEGIFWGIEGSPKAVATGAGIARSLGGRVLRLRAGQKPLYHAACAMASNYLVVILDRAAALLHEAGISGEKALRALFPLVEGTLQNVKALDTSRALTGPIARGDARSVEAHLMALRRFPGVSRAYRTLGRLALDSAAKQGLSAPSVRLLRRLLESERPLLRVPHRSAS